MEEVVAKAEAAAEVVMVEVAREAGATNRCSSHSKEAHWEAEEEGAPRVTAEAAREVVDRFRRGATQPPAIHAHSCGAKKS